jgi:VacB/RNase II family 3'-5' exoribonuclease
VAQLPDEPPVEAGLRNLIDLLWCSIDNDDTMDIDQVTVAEPVGDGAIRIRIGIADVDQMVAQGSAIDRRAERNTTTVYTPARIFPMLPVELSEERTSLMEGRDRTAVIMELTVERDGSLGEETVYRALVRNHAKLAYDSLSAWLEGERDELDKVSDNPALQECVRLHDEAAQRLLKVRRLSGALDLETIEARPVLDGDEVVDLVQQPKNRGRQIIEDFMIAANGVSTRFLEERKQPTFRRVVRTPKRWERIVTIADKAGFTLPSEPDPRALEEFLEYAREKDPTAYPDVSLSIVKLLGRGEYAAALPGEEPVGHFGLAVDDYSHSTAPNRRFPDVITHRLLKAALEERRPPYSKDELRRLAAHCTEQEDDAKKIERQVRKSAAAMLLRSRIGEHFNGIVTGASSKGTWVRIFEPPVEGKLLHGWKDLDVGDRVRVKLTGIDIERGWIDFRR